MSCPDDPQRSRFNRVQEKARIDVEQAFGAQKKRWQILAKSVNVSWSNNYEKYDICVYILHNMIKDHEENTIFPYDENQVIPDTQSL